MIGVCGVDLCGSEHRQVNIAISERVQQNPENFLSICDLLDKRKGLCSMNLAAN
jgi:hypothetical protein